MEKLLEEEGAAVDSKTANDGSDEFPPTPVETHSETTVDSAQVMPRPKPGVIRKKTRVSRHHENEIIESLSVEVRISLAAVHVNTAMRGELAEVDSYFHALSPLAIRLYWWYVSRMWFNLFVIVAGCHMLLAFIENPSNLEYESLSAGPFSPGQEDLGLDTLLVYTQHSHRDFEMTMIFHSIELLFVAVYVIDLMAYYVIVGKQTFFEETWVRIQIFAVTFIGLNTLYCLIVTTFQNPALMKYAPQLSRLMRPFVLMYKMRHVRNVFDSILASIPHILNVMVLLALMMIIFGAFFYTIFAGIDLHTCKFFAQAVLNTTHNISTKHGGFRDMDDILAQHSNETVEITGTCDQYQCFCSSWGQNCTNYFNSIFNSLLHLFIMLTTANFPDIMIPVSQCAWPFTLFFITFLATGLFFLLNLLLAVVYNKFQQKAEGRLESQLDNAKAAARRAFAIVTDHGDRMDMEVWSLLIKYIRTKSVRCCSGVRILPEELDEPIFRVFDRNTGTVNEEAFTNLLQFASLRCIKNDVEVAPSEMPWEQMDWKRKMLEVRLWCDKNVLQNKYCTYTTVAIIGAYIIYALAVLAAGEHSTGTGWIVVHWIFMAYFLLEIGFRMFVQGPKEYFYDSRNRDVQWLNGIDFVVVVGSVIVDPITYIPNEGDLAAVLAGLKSIAPILREFRVLRMFQAIKFYELQLTTMQRMMSPLLRYFGVIACLMYFFGTLTMELFAGKLDAPDCENFAQQNCVENLEEFYSNHTSVIRYRQVAATSYAKGQFWTYNFNTIHMSITILFQQLVVNNWPVIMEGLMVAYDEQPGWSHESIVIWRIFVVTFFVMLHIFQVMIFLNVLIAFLVDAYQVNMEQLIEQRNNKDKEFEWRLRLNDLAMQVHQLDISEWIIDKKKFSKSLLLYGNVENMNEQMGELHRRSPSNRNRGKPVTMAMSEAAVEVEMAERDM